MLLLSYRKSGQRLLQACLAGGLAVALKHSSVRPARAFPVSASNCSPSYGCADTPSDIAIATSAAVNMGCALTLHPAADSMM